ncbi:MAG: glycosyltransferase family 4 protein [Chloroflexi bacterium]|nr:glycosyltransferase family 4 protein [Chloroflexota bacterium]
MRLTIVNQFYLPDLSPTAHLAASLAEHRAARGDQVTVVAGSGAYAAAPAAGAPRNRGSARLRRIWTPSLGKRSALRRATDYAIFFAQAKWTLLTLPRQDVILLMTTPPYIALTGIVHQWLHRRTRLILWSMDCYPETLERAGILREGGLVSRLLRGANHWLYRRLERVVCLDEAMRSMLEQAYGVKGHPQLDVIPNWEPAALFPAGRKPSVWEGVERLSLEGRQVVLYTGNAGAGHRFETILAAGKMLPASEFAFLFVGGGSAWPALQTAKDSMGLEHFIIEGYVPEGETPSVLAAADVALITLRDEMLGVMSPSKLHSALAMRLPILYIGPAGGNVHEAIDRFGCGVSLRHGDVEGAVAFLTRLKDDPAARRQYASRARQAFETAYNDRVALAQFDSLLDG